MNTLRTIKAIALAVAALASFGSMLLPAASETFMDAFGPDLGAAWSAICFVSFIFFCSGLSETTKTSTH